MKAEIFEKIAKAITEYKAPGTTFLDDEPNYKLHSLTETEEYKHYMFYMGKSFGYDQSIDIARANLKKNSNAPSYGPAPVKWFMSLKYDKIKDKISLARYEVGYGYSRRQKRYYPHKANTPLMCYSKHLYSFIQVGRSKNKLIRIATPSNTHDVCAKLMAGVIYPDLQIDRYQFAKIPFKYLNGTDNLFDAYENMSGIRIPQALRNFEAEYVIELTSALKDSNELNRLCQYLARSKDRVNGMISSLRFSPQPFWLCVSDMLFQDMGHKDWLIRDWIADHRALGRKVSLKISSEKRMSDEHNKMSIERMAKRSPEIKVAGVYKNMFKKFPIQGAELILDKNRLVQESVEQRHCVATYAHKINAGQCAIISIPYNSEQYTMEVGLDCNSHMYNAQLRGKCNKEAPKELHDIVNRFFEITAGKAVPALPF